MAVLPLNSSTKLDQEPNPFEQSFSGASSEEKMGNMNNSNKLTLPPVASLTSPAITKSALNNGNGVVIGGGILPKEVANQFTWDTLRTGPLSPSMLQGPANPDDYYGKSNNSMPPNTTYSTRSSFATTSTLNTTNNDMQYMQQPIKIEQQQYMPQQQPQKRQRSISQNTDNDSIGSNDSSVINKKTNKKSTRNTTRRRSSNLVTDSGNEDDVSMREKSKSSSKEPEDDEKRKNFLERNRIAALKCRQRKKQWLNNLQAKVEFLSSDNERLQLQSESLKEEIVNLKTLLLAHKECPVAQSNGFHASAIQKGGMPSMLSQQQQMMGRNSAPYGLNRQQPPPPQPASASTSSSIPRYTRTNMNIQSQDNQTMMAGGNTANGNNVGAGGTSSVLRF
ncbi:unnamed protein product [Mucor hiemalis]